jgi:HD-GYP domain-containing protein (c-di-GMP phosphodiesterase class II)
LAGYSIRLNARIFAVVDVFDALTSAKPHKPPFRVDEALLTIMQGAGKHFDT